MSTRKKRRRGRHEAFGRTYGAPGTEPGTLEEWERDWAEGHAPKLTISDLDQGQAHVREGADVGTCRKSLADPTITWVHVQGDLPPEKLKILGEQFGLHSLALEDVLHKLQRPKSEVYGRELFVVMAAPRVTVVMLIILTTMSLMPAPCWPPRVSVPPASPCF